MRTARRLGRTGAAYLGLALVVCGCALPATPSLTTVPPSWRRQHPFGIAANTARERGELQILYVPPQADQWRAFAHATIQDGDILFRLGRSCTVRGCLTSRFLADVCDSRFSHDSLAHWEGDELWVYDSENEGVRKVPFVFWMMDVAEHHFAVRRLLPQYRDCLPRAFAFCEDAYQRNVPYDKWLQPGDEQLYCSELIELAFRAGGLALSEPVPIRCLPNYRRYSASSPFLEALTPLRMDQVIFVAGNRHYGTYGSPYLERVYETHDRGQEWRKPPSEPRGATPPS